MYDTIDRRAKIEILKQLVGLNAKAARSAYYRSLHIYDKQETHYKDEFTRLDSLLRSIYTPSAIAFIYGEAITKLTLENRGEVALKELIDKVINYQKGKR